MLPFHRSPPVVLLHYLSFTLSTSYSTRLYAHQPTAALAFAFSSTSPDAIYQNSSGAMWQPLSSLYAISFLATLASRGTFGSGQPALRPTSHTHSFGLATSDTRSLMPSPYPEGQQTEGQKSKSNGRVALRELSEERDGGRRREEEQRPELAPRKAEREKDEEAIVGL